MCALLFFHPPPLQEPSGCMSVRIKEALRPQSSKCCQQVNSPSLIALYPSPHPTKTLTKKKGKESYSCSLWATSDCVMKMSQLGKALKQKSTTCNSLIFISAKVDWNPQRNLWLTIVCLSLSLSSCSNVHREIFKKVLESKVMPVKLPTPCVSAPANIISLH